MRAAIELGPKGKKFVAYAIDWPGLERKGKSVEEAFAHMDSYRPRYEVIADRAGLGDLFRSEPKSVIELEYEGVGSTDFWGISFAHSPIDHDPIAKDDLERQFALLQAAWDEMDDIQQRVSSEMQKGPRGGGRDRDHIVGHVLAAELDWVKKLDIRPEFDAIKSRENRKLFHASIIDALREHHERGTDPRAKGGPAWRVRFFVRHLAYHVLDHAWEMEDKDLTGISPASN